MHESVVNAIEFMLANGLDPSVALSGKTEAEVVRDLFVALSPRGLRSHALLEALNQRAMELPSLKRRNREQRHS
jgi:hypothetical protein